MTIKERKDKLGVNPFSVSLEIPISVGVENGVYEKKEGVLLPKEIEYENTVYTRLYAEKELKEIYKYVSPSASKLLLWIMLNVYKQEDCIYIDNTRVMEDMGVKSINTVKKNIDELIRYGFITLSRHKQIYWINPMFFFKGNRVVKFPKNTVTKYDYR